MVFEVESIAQGNVGIPGGHPADVWHFTQSRFQFPAADFLSIGQHRSLRQGIVKLSDIAGPGVLFHK